MHPIKTLYETHLKELLATTEQQLEALGFSGLLIASGIPQRCFLDDHDYPFTVNPHFKRWLPVTDNPHCFVFIQVGCRPRLLYLQPEDFWHATAGGPEGYWVESFDVHVFSDASMIMNDLAQRDLSRFACIAQENELVDRLPGVKMNPPGLMAVMHYTRAVKSPYELHCMRQANRIAYRGHKAARDAFEAGHSELEVHLAYLAACGHTEAQSPYGNIVAFNENAAVLHNNRYGVSRLAPSQRRSFLIDAGAEYDGYIADITRTYAGSDGEFADLILRMDSEQLAICEEVKPGVAFTELHERMHQRLAGVLVDFDLVNCTAESAFEQGLTRLFFPHGLGHLIGLQTHDVGGWQKNPSGDQFPAHPDYPFLRLQRTLEEGMAVTIEPGIYFIEMLLAPKKGDKALNWQTIDRMKPYGGIRVEDTVVPTENGAENLTRPAFAE